jgi:hypothetical protein
LLLGVRREKRVDYYLLSLLLETTKKIKNKINNK